MIFIDLLIEITNNIRLLKKDNVTVKIIKTEDKLVTLLDNLYNEIVDAKINAINDATNSNLNPAKNPENKEENKSNKSSNPKIFLILEFNID